jgi:serine/threonine protein kinase/thiol-disulfide isomerase/thioredoxin
MTDPSDPAGNPPDETIDSSADRSSQGFPSQIGQYAIKRIIASGGMGTVYEALQENPRRPAAVKVVKRGMASAEGLQRFEREAQALARLRHPGIAQIYEAGTFEDEGVSLPYFALEYIPNARTIIEYARTKNLGVRQKLDLFTQVCEAVHYGHQRGIIHRDLKPANILVDSEGRTRIIDFGVARAVDADQTDADAQTRVGQIVGTAQYMSPEQFEADPNDLDTRSDIYALGVVLFELLAGCLPYEFGNSGVFEIARVVRDEPATTLGSAAPGIDHEIELIVAKALDKDRERRYQSAFGLAQDIRRHLKGEAITAQTGSFSYQARVFARRNKTVVGLVAAVAVLLVGGILWTSKLVVDVSAERLRAETSAERAIAANEFMKNALASAVPGGWGDQRTIGDLCDRAAEDLDEAFPDDPVTESDIRLTIGKIYSMLDKRKEAEFQLKKAYDLRTGHLGRTHEQTVEALEELRTFYLYYGPGDKYLERARELYAIALELYGPDDERTIDADDSIFYGLARVGNYNEAVRETQRFISLIEEKYGPNSIEAIVTRVEYAFRQLRAGRIEEAAATASESYRMIQEVENATTYQQEQARNTYAMMLLVSGRVDEAKQLFGNKRPPPLSQAIEFPFQTGPEVPDGDFRILVFWESWCPFCERHLPLMERISRQYRDLGVEVIGLVGVTLGSTDDKVRQFIADNEVSFSVFKENGRLSNFFGNIGIPYTVILHQGDVIWEGSGAGSLDRRVIEGLVNAD